MSTAVEKEQKIKHPYIERKKGIFGGEPVIAGTRISVSLIAELERTGHTADEIVAMYPHITHAQVYDALSYYYHNRAEIDRIIEENREDYWLEKTKGEDWRK